VSRNSLLLCIDDEALGLEIRKAVLERAGFRVLTALDGPTGLGLFLEHPVHGVILDYFMPAMDGGQVAVEMRKQRPEIPILLLSAYINLPSDLIELVNVTVLKGDGPEKLIEKVREMLENESRLKLAGEPQ
jgi:CheY-like chemotaxis protein